TPLAAWPQPLRPPPAASAPSRGRPVLPSETAAYPSTPAPGRCDLAVVGGGIIGLAVARELVRRLPRARVCVLEQEPAVATHQTGHNSGLIHAGLYYEPGSLKARLCVDGARELDDYCAARSISHERGGTLIVATHR